MPGNVDERVVEMRIDNKQFESGAKTTISTLGKLEKALQIKSSSKAIDEMADSVSKFDASPMATSIDKVGDHFNVLETIGRRVIENLTDSVYGFATKTVKELTIGQVTEGWDKYASKTEAVQSIMAATRDQFDDEAEQMEVINALLDKMMWYTDETSYNFVDMAQNVGKFLAAGVGLGEGENIEDPFNAMMGIASWGASAGAKPAEVSRAMYNISQALSTGKMAQIDWKSIENAGMATLEFKQNVIDTAVELGKLKVWEGVGENNKGIQKFYDAAEDMSNAAEDTEKLFDAKSFREQLKSGWFDTEVMSTVFQRYAEFTDNLYSGYQETGLEASKLLEILDKARDNMEGFDWDYYATDAGVEVDTLRTAIQRLIDTQWEYSEQGFRMGQEAKTWEDTLEATKDAVSSKWMRTFQWVIGDYLEAKDFWTEVTERMYNAFAAGGDVRNDILEAWYGAGGRKAWFSLEEKSLGAFWNLLDAFETIVGPIRDGFYKAFGIDTQEGIKAVGERLAALSERFRELTANIGFSEEAQQGLRNIFTAIFSGYKLILKAFGGVIAVVGKFVGVIGEILDAVLSLASGEVTLDEVTERIKNAIKAFLGQFSNMSKVFDSVRKRAESIVESLRDVSNYLRAIGLEGSEFITDSLYGGFNAFEKLLVQLGEKFPIVVDILSYAGYYLDQLLHHFDEFSFEIPKISDITEDIVYWFTQLKNAVKGVNIDMSGVTGIFGRIKNVADVLFAALFGDSEQFKEKIKSLVSTALGGVLEAIKEIKISDILAAIRVGLVAGFLGGFLDVVRSFHMVANEVKSIPEAITDTLSSLQKSFQATSYIKMAVAIGILAASIYALAKVPAEDFMRVVVGLGLLALVIQKLSKGINIFSGSNNSGDTITKGLKANIKLIPDLAATILALAVAMGVMAHAVIQFKKYGIGTGKNGWADLLMPIGTLVITLLSIIGFLYLLKKYDLKDIGKSFGLLITVFAIIGKITKLVSATKNVPWYNLLIVMAGVSGIMLSMAVMLRFASGLKKFKDNQILHAAALMLAVGVFVSMASSSVAKLGKMKTGKLIQGLIAVGLLMAALGGLMTWMSKLDTAKAGNIMKIAASLALVAVALNLLVIPLMALSVIPFWSMMGALLGVAGIIAILSAALAVLSKLGGEKSGSILKIAAALALMSVALALVLPSLMTFTGFLVGLAAVLNGKMILKLTGLALIMVVLGAGLAAAGIGVALFGVGLLAVAASAFLFSIALLAITSALDKLGEAFPKLIQGLIDSGKLMTAENARDIALGAVAFIALAAGIFLVAKAFGALFGKTDVIAKLGSFGGRLVGSLGTIIHNVGTKIMDSLPLILQILSAAAVVIGLYAIGLIPKLTSMFVQAIITLLESIHQSVRANKAALEHSIFGTVEVLLEIIIDSGTWVVTIIRTLIDTAVSSILEWLASKVENIPLIGSGLADSLRGIADELPDPAELMSQWQDQRQSNSEWLQQFVPPAEELKDAAQQTTESIGTGIIDGKSSVTEAVDDLKTTVSGTFDAFEGDFSLKGEAGVTAYASGMDSKADVPVKESGIIGGNVVNTFESLVPKANSSGSNFLAGWNNGLVDFWNNGTIQKNIGTVTSGITDQLFSGLDEHSPSKISEEAGSFYIIGLANGISNNIDAPLDAIDEITDPMYEAIKKTMMEVATITDDDFTISPTITPVVDMSNVDSAAGSMDSLLGGSYSSYVDSMSNKAMSVSSTTQSTSAERRSSSDAALSEIQAVGDRINSLAEAITNMQIILDTGVLVGATSAKMDARLGVLAARKGRGN